MRRKGTQGVSHQTVRLSPGSHRSPEDGVCVMELASMLAGEPFSDHPRSVCPVIAAFLRAYNDHIDERCRQDLYGYAAASVGTRGDCRMRRVRTALCRRFAERYEVSPPARAAALLSLGQAGHAGQRAGTAAALTDQPQAHSMALALLDTLIACGDREDGPARGGLHVGEPGWGPGSRRVDIQP